MTNIGMRIYTKINRPSPDLISQFEGLPVPVIADNMNRMFCMDARIRPFNDKKLLGSAFTIRTRPGDNLLVHKALDLAEPGDILVVDAQGDLTNAIIGELMALYAQKRNLGGLIIDGAVRDVDALRHLDIPIYAAGVNPRGPYKDGPGEINVPINCGGAVVNPGDILVGDQDGIVVINPADAEQLLIHSRNKLASEEETKKEIANLDWDRTWVDKALISKNTVIQ
ncbi:RraA family protein [Pseudoneobacillus rhizosphaerae]|jgi:RraA family protein|uniref:Putative 4-hydroxy-4-methyl-2-oxoglutarate aldolase n=1 Tax=Pseudoneobacillus rhizosphaerae TaxID=2880968 RepID=A0A9C7LBF4_9BACI|nr:RraA family protein [Pseudoneobacillus rhizosphaerae]CAG9609102.1 4-carboxy-4-hydroxy-2-oxoadipate aldolase [Pseudoneobacillus rhizosphaerae]